MRRALVARFNEAHLCRGSMVHISVGGPSGCFCGTAVVYAVQRSLSGTLPLTLMYRFFAGGDMRAHGCAAGPAAAAGGAWRRAARAAAGLPGRARAAMPASRVWQRWCGPSRGDQIHPLQRLAEGRGGPTRRGLPLAVTSAVWDGPGR